MPHPYDDKLKARSKGDESRRERLAAELRANLVKRKERARALARSGRAAEREDASE